MRLGRLGWLLMAGALVIVACAVFPLPQLGLWGNPGCGFSSNGCTRILFIGNSYTGMNDLPATFASLAWANGHRVETGALDQGGSTLAEHAADPATATELSSEKWNVVVLQEQSEIPSVPSYRSSEMYPAATELVTMIREQGAQPLFYLTFAHEDGWPQAGLPNYQSMQSAIDDGYLGIATQLGVSIAPVGDAWQTLVDDQAQPGLWQSDGSHPTVRGTYLASCVFYAVVFRASPVGLSYRDGLSVAESRNLQQVAATAVLKNPGYWGLPLELGGTS
jgi:hypothetical protein